jgi:hypothetical protein
MLSILFLLLWQLLTLTLTGVVYCKQRNSGFLVLAGLLLLQILANVFQLEAFSSNPIFFRVRYAISALSVAGYAFLLLRHLKHSLFKHFASAMLGCFICAAIYLLWMPSDLLTSYINYLLVAASISMVLLSVRYLYEIALNPPIPLPHSSFPSFVWMAAGICCYFLSMSVMHAFYGWLQHITLPVSGSWIFNQVNQVLLVALYIFFCIALLIGLPNTKRCI